MKKTTICGAVALSLMVQGCSSRPREFRPLLAAAPGKFASGKNDCAAIYGVAAPTVNAWTPQRSSHKS